MNKSRATHCAAGQTWLCRKVGFLIGYWVLGAVLGWLWGGSGFWRSWLLVVVLFSAAISNAKECAEAVQLASFEKAWGKDFSRYPNPTQLAEGQLRRQLLNQEGLNPQVRDFLSKGGSPLELGSAMLLDGLGAAYLKIIDASNLKENARQALRDSLARALSELKGRAPKIQLSDGYGGEGGDGGSGGGGGIGGGGHGGDNGALGTPARPYDEQIVKILKDESLKRCVIRSTILFTVSSVINTATALQARWSEYAGPAHGTFFDKLSSSTTWGNAWSDPHFRHNVTWNGILMLSIGALSCMRNQDLGRKLIMAVTAAASAAGQYFSTGEVKLSQTVFDVLYVRIISVNKSNGVFYLSEKYAAANLPVPYLAEIGMQGISEGVGGWIYARVNLLNDRLWNGPPEDQ